LTSDTLTRHRPIFFQPLVVALFSVATASLYGGYLLLSTGLNFSGSFFYVVPIIVPFVAFLFDRTEHWREARTIRVAIDLLIVGTAIGSMLGPVPFVSGHTLFLTYALLSSRSLIVRISATVVLLHAMYLKYVVWHDWTTSTSGIVLGAIAAYVANRLIQNPREQTNG
jgi:hypothetical protein